MEPGSGCRRLQWLDSLAQKRRQNPRQNITAAAGGHACIAGPVDISFCSVGDDRLMSLSKDHAAGLPGQRLGACDPIPLRRLGQAAKFTLMGRQDHGTSCSAQYIYMSRSGVYSVGIQNQRAAAVPQEFCHQPIQLHRASQARSQQAGVNRALKEPYRRCRRLLGRQVPFFLGSPLISKKQKLQYLLLVLGLFGPVWRLHCLLDRKKQ